MRSYWKEFENDYFYGIECPECKSQYTDDLFQGITTFDEMKALLFYCPACGHKNLETELEIKDREKARKMFSEYWAHYNEEC